MAGSHSRLAPSSAHRWMLCGQSVAGPAPEGDDSSEASREGTVAHGLGENCLHDGTDAWEHIGNTVDGVEVTKEMAERVQVRLDYVRATGKLDVSPGEYRHWCERKLTHEEFHPELGGTIDDLFIDKWGHCEIIDYKDGFIHVEVERNPQLMSYAWLAACKNSELDKFTLTIIQPKNEANPIRSWGISRDELELWAYTELLPAMENAGKGDYVTGDHCKYCPRLKNLTCVAHNEELDSISEHEEAEVQVMPAEHLAELKEKLKVIDRLSKAVDAELERRLLTLGQDVPGWKVVEKVAARVWKDGAENAVSSALGSDGYTLPALKSPAQLEKLPGAAALVAEWAYKPKVGLTVAPESDKRMAVSSVDVYKDVV